MGAVKSVLVGSALGTLLSVTVFDSFSNPIPQASVVFTAPATGPSGTFGGQATVTVLTDAAGVATAPAFTADSVTGSYAITAAVTGTSLSTTFALTNVTTAPTTIALASSSNPSVSDQSVTFTATVTASSPGANIPTGTVYFFDGATMIGTGTLNGSGVATVGVALASVGTHSITAQYQGDAIDSPSTSSALSQVVAGPPIANPLSVVLPDSGITTITLTGSDAVTPAANLVYTVASLPATGTLDDQNGAAVTIGETFVGNAAVLTYLLPSVYIGSLSTSFNFTVTDTGFPAGSGQNVLTSSPAAVSISTPAGSTGIVRVHGTSGNDTIAIGQTTTGNFLQVTINSVVVSNTILLASARKVEVFTLTGNDRVDVSGWTGSGELVGGGGSDTVVAAKAVNQTLTNSKLIANDGLSMVLSGIGTANLTDPATGTHAAVFLDVSGWTGGGALVGNGNDTVVATKIANFTLSDSLVTASDGLSMTLSGFVVAELFGGAGDQQFDVSGWTGRGELVGNGGNDTVVSTKAGLQVLTNSRLSASDGLHIPLIGIANADLTDSTIGSHSSNYFYVSGWTGGGSLTGTGNDGIIATKNADFTLSNSLFASSDGLNMATTGISRAYLTGGPGNNQFDVSGFTGSGQLTGGGGSDTVVAAKNTHFTLTDTSLTTSDGLHVTLSGIGLAKLTDTGGPHTIDALSFSGQDTLNAGSFGDVLYGGSGSNVIAERWRKPGNDILIGGSGNDTLNGGGGSDLLIDGVPEEDDSPLVGYRKRT